MFDLFDVNMFPSIYTVTHLYLIVIVRRFYLGFRPNFVEYHRVLVLFRRTCSVGRSHVTYYDFSVMTSQHYRRIRACFESASFFSTQLYWVGLVYASAHISGFYRPHSPSGAVHHRYTHEMTGYIWERSSSESFFLRFYSGGGV